MPNMKSLSLMVKKIIAKVKLYTNVGPRSLGQNVCHDRKGLIRMNVHMKYESSTSKGLKNYGKG